MRIATKIIHLMTYFLAMDLTFPRLRHVMRIVNDFGHQQFGVKYSVVLRDHASGDSQRCRKDREIEEYGPMRRDFEIQEKIGVYY